MARQPKLLDDFLIMGISLNDLLGIYPGIYWDLTIGIGDILWYSIILIGDIWRYCDMCDFLLDISSMVNCEILDIWCFFVVSIVYVSSQPWVATAPIGPEVPLRQGHHGGTARAMAGFGVRHFLGQNHWYHGKWPIEIDGLPINSMVIFHGELLNNQMVFAEHLLTCWLFIC